ncbi:MAG TPA: hypothetical protein VFZ65_06830 [Planctomycetota bacterium]|nr:hypothetical protein [Planctomycetota bacterium]
MPSPWPTPVLAVLLAVGSSSPEPRAQAPEGVERRPAFVRVFDAAGEPAVAAAITLAGCLPHLGAVAGPSDVQHVQSDARGRAVPKLQAGLCYVAWAVLAADGQHGARTSAVHGYFGAGAQVDLRCDTESAPERVRVDGAEAWAGLGPLRFFSLSALPGIEVELLADADGALVVPPGPATTIEARTRDGEPLFSATSDGGRFVIPPPQPLRVRVVDEHGEPLPGALVQHRVTRRLPWRLDGLGGVAEDRCRDLGVVDAQGRATVRVPYDADPLRDRWHGDLLLLAGVPGQPRVAGGIKDRTLIGPDRTSRTRQAEELLFTCPHVEPLRGVCRAVPAGTLVHLAAVATLFRESESFTHDARAFVTEVGADGRFAFTELPAELHSCRLTFVPPRGSARLLPIFPAMRGRELPVEVQLREPMRSANLDDGAAALTLVVTEPGGGPARGVVAFLAPAELGGVLLRDSLVRFPLDARGAATMRLALGKWVVLAASSLGWVAQSVDLTSGERTVALSMQPLAVMRLELRDREGQPVAGARIWWRGTKTRGTGDPVLSMEQGLRVQAQTSGDWSALTTDAQGRLDIPFVPVSGLTQTLCLSWAHEVTPDFVLEANDTPLLLRPR